MSNIDFDNISFDLPKNQSNVIKVVGVGGGGSNAVNHMYKQGIKGVDFVICNTDAQALQNSPIPIKIQLGVSLTEGLGAGANPEVGGQAAEESYEDIKAMLATNTKMVFITVGMGGGTGTGAAPIIARAARELELLTIGIVTIPFSFEGKTRNQQAQQGIENLSEYVDSMVIINNNKLREVYGNLGFKAGFAKADEVLSTAARGIAEVITHHYTQNIDLKDAKTVLSDSGTAIMGSATASGPNRSEEAISKALHSPLLNDNKITGAKNVLLLIISGEEEITLDEIGEINDFIQSEANSNVNIIMGIGEDTNLGEAISVTIIATGFNKDQQSEFSNSGPKRIIHTLIDEQQTTVDLTETIKTSENSSSPNASEQHETTSLNHSKRKKIHLLSEEGLKPLSSDVENTEVKKDIQETSSNDVDLEEQHESTDEKSEFVVKRHDLYDQTDIPNFEKEAAEHSFQNKIQENQEDDEDFEIDEPVLIRRNQIKTNDSSKEETPNETSNKDENQVEKLSETAKNTTPFNLTIAELKSKTDARKEKFKKMNYQFKPLKGKNGDEKA
jgi:cell division protein FtsZ